MGRADTDRKHRWPSSIFLAALRLPNSDSSGDGVCGCCAHLRDSSLDWLDDGDDSATRAPRNLNP